MGQRPVAAALNWPREKGTRCDRQLHIMRTSASNKTHAHSTRIFHVRFLFFFFLSSFYLIVLASPVSLRCGQETMLEFIINSMADKVCNSIVFRLVVAH